MPTTRARSTLVTGLVLMMGTALLVGCAAGTEGSAGSQTSAEPVEGGTLALSISAEPGCLDPHPISATQQALLARITSANPATLAERGQLAPYLADRWATAA